MANPGDLSLLRAREEAVKAATELNGFQLARLAECGEPTARESEGARMLGRVRDGVIELLEGLEVENLRLLVEDPDDIGWLENDGAVYEVADGAPDIYTHTRWLQFVDLAAWQEDTEELPAGDLTEVAGIALVRISERLAWALLTDAAVAIYAAADR